MTRELTFTNMNLHWEERRNSQTWKQTVCMHSLGIISHSGWLCTYSGLKVAEEENAKGLGRGSPPFQKQFLSVTSSTLRCSECSLGLSVSSTGNHILCSFPFLVHLNASQGMVSDVQDWISGSYIFLLQPQQFPLANIITQLLKSSSYFSIKYPLWKYSAILLFLEMVNFDWGLLYKIKHTFDMSVQSVAWGSGYDWTNWMCQFLWS